MNRILTIKKRDGITVTLFCFKLSVFSMLLTRQLNILLLNTKKYLRTYNANKFFRPSYLSLLTFHNSRRYFVMKPKLFYLFCLFTFIFFLEATATVRYVSKTGSSVPPYTSWATASDSIQKCINICQSGDTVYVGNGVYKEKVVNDQKLIINWRRNRQLYN